MQRKTALIKIIWVMGKQEFQINYGNNMYRAIPEREYESAPLGPKEFIHKSIFPQIFLLNCCE